MSLQGDSSKGEVTSTEEIFNVGPKIKIMKCGATNMDEVNGIVNRYIPNATLSSLTETVCTYSLPDGQMDQLAEMFEMMESRKDNLFIAGIGLEESNMEDIFVL